MIGRPLMTPDELKSLPKGHFILAKTGCHPMRVELRLFFKWGIEFEEEYEVEQHVARPVSYADRLEVEQEIIRRQFDEDGEADFDEPSGIEGLQAEVWRMYRCQIGRLLQKPDSHFGQIRGREVCGIL